MNFRFLNRCQFHNPTTKHWVIDSRIDSDAFHRLLDTWIDTNSIYGLVDNGIDSDALHRFLYSWINSDALHRLLDTGINSDALHRFFYSWNNSDFIYRYSIKIFKYCIN